MFRARLSGLTIAASLCFTNTAAGTSLSDAVAIAYNTNPTILAQRASLRALDEGFVAAIGTLGPQVNLTAQIEHQDASIDEPASFFSSATSAREHARTDTESLSISQVLYNGGQSASQINAAEADIFAGREQLRSTELQVMRQLIGAYADVQRDEAVLQIYEQSLALLVDEQSKTEARFRVHEVTVTDRAQAAARLNGARASLAAARGRLSISRASYLQVVGQNPDSLEPLADLGGLPKNIDQAFDLAEANSPALRNTQYTERGSRARIDQEKAQGNTTVTLRLDLLNSPQQPYDASLYEKSFSARAIVSKPLFTSGILKARVRAAIDRNARDRLNVDAQRRLTIQQVAQAWASLLAAGEALKAQREQVGLQQIAYQGATAEQKAGLRTTIEVLNAEQELQDARRAVVEAEHDRLLAEADVLATTGLLQAASLSNKIEVYRPEAHLRSVAMRGGAPWAPILRAIDEIKAPRPAPLPIHDPAGELRPNP